MTAANFYSLMFSPRLSWELSGCMDSFAASAAFFAAARFFQFTASGGAPADFVLFLPLMTLGWISSAAILHFFAHAFGGRGSVTDFFKLLPFTELPFLFLPAARLLSGALFVSFSGSFVLMFAGLYFWSLALKIKALMFNYRLSSVGAFASLAAPLAAALALGAAAVFLRVAAAVI